jgi:hypothetical protein
MVNIRVSSFWAKFELMSFDSWAKFVWCPEIKTKVHLFQDPRKTVKNVGMGASGDEAQFVKG